MSAGRCFAARSFLTIAVWTFVSGALAAPGWRTDLAEAQNEAKRLDRPLLLHFFAEWCVPCRQMDREVFLAPGILPALCQRIVPVKLDVDQHRDVASRYSVESIPADVFVAPDGRVLGVMNGVRSSEDYLRRVVAIERQYARQRDLFLARSEGKGPALTTTDLLGPRFPVLEPPVAEPEPPSGPRVKKREDGTVLVGLKGHSPVALFRDRKWVRGDAKYAWEHQGLTYLMTSSDELAAFQKDAERYAPRLLGCDPVLYVDEGRAVPGSIAFAAYFSEGLFLFTSAENRTRFRESPDRYARRRTVLLIDELEPIVR